MKTVAQLRLEKEKTRAEVASAIEMSESGYTNIELGHRSPSFRIARRLAKYFGVAMEDIDFGFAETSQAS